MRLCAYNCSLHFQIWNNIQFAKAIFNRTEKMIIEVGNNKSKQEKKTMNDVVSKLYLETSK